MRWIILFTELWESLEKKYKTKDVKMKKFVVGRFLDFVMVVSKNVSIQIQEILVIIHGIYAKGMSLSEFSIYWNYWKTFILLEVFQKLFEAQVQVNEILSSFFLFHLIFHHHFILIS